MALKGRKRNKRKRLALLLPNHGMQSIRPMRVNEYSQDSEPCPSNAIRVQKLAACLLDKLIMDGYIYRPSTLLI